MGGRICYGRWCWSIAGLLGAALLLTSFFFAGTVGAQNGERPDFVTAGAPPFTDTFGAMVRRERQLAADVAAGRRPPRPRIRVIPEPRERDSGRTTPPDTGEYFPAPGRSGSVTPQSPTGGGTAPAPQAPQTSGGGFPGPSLSSESQDFGQQYIPPDTMGAIGPSHFVEMINGSVTVFTRTGTVVSRVHLDTFFALTSGGVSYPRNGAFDPRILFDRRTGRWYACVLEMGANGSDPSNNHLLLAVSRTADPTGTWDKYVLRVGLAASGTTSYFTDYQTMGIDENGLYFGMTIFGSNNSYQIKLVATPLAPLIAASPSLGAVSQFAGITDMYGSPQPAVELDAPGAPSRQWFIASSAVEFGNVTLRSMTWSSGVPSLSSTQEVSTAGYAAPLKAPASGSGGIDAGDDRMQAAVIRDGHLWSCRTIAVNASGSATGADRNAVEWFELNATGSTPTVVQNGRVYDASAAPRHYYAGSIAVTGQGYAALGFSGSRGSEYVGIYTCGRAASDPEGTMQPILALKSGEATYNLYYGGDTRVRWGDYSATWVDPADDQTVWSVQEYAGASANTWATWVSRLLAPRLTLNNPGATAAPGQTGASVALTGTGFFDPGAGYARRLTAAISGDGISNVAVTYSSPTSATLTFDVASTATAGSRNITLTNPDGQSATAAGGLTIDGGGSTGTATMAFDNDTYSTKETLQTALITVSRTGDTAAASTVRYATANGSAASGDYTPASGTLTFDAGVTTASFSIPVADDNLLEGSETVRLTLSSPSAGGALGSPSAVNLVITDDAVKPAPTSLTAQVTSVSSVKLRWLDNCGNESAYQVQRSTDAGATWSTVATLPAGSITFTNTGLTTGASYVYRVRARNGTLASAWSNRATVGLKAPAAASALTAGRASSTAIALSWLDNSTNETGFKVQRSSDGGATWTKITTRPAAAGKGTTINYQNTGLTTGTTYSYRIIAYNGAGDAVPSNVASAKP
jgi:hypothetical protein